MHITLHHICHGTSLISVNLIILSWIEGIERAPRGMYHGYPMYSHKRWNTSDGWMRLAMAEFELVSLIPKMRNTFISQCEAHSKSEDLSDGLLRVPPLMVFRASAHVIARGGAQRWCSAVVARRASSVELCDGSSRLDGFEWWGGLDMRGKTCKSQWRFLEFGRKGMY